MERPHALAILAFRQAVNVESQAEVDVPLRQVVAVNQDLTYLVGRSGVLAFLWISTAQQEFAVAAFDHGLGVALNLVHDAQNLGDFGIQRCLGAEEDVAVRVRGFIAVIDQLGVGADRAIVTAKELEEAENAPLLLRAEHERRGRFK